MSHVVNYFNYKDVFVNAKAKRAKIQAWCDRKAATENYMEGGTGLGSPIQWRDDLTPFKNQEAAGAYVEEMSQKYSYLEIAVPYYKPGKRTKAIEALEEKLQKATRECAEMDDQIYYTPATIKSQFITCKECGSKLSVKHLGRNTCPVCGHDLRPDTFHNRMNKMREKISALAGQISDCTKSPKKEKWWLVKIEYHV